MLVRIQLYDCGGEALDGGGDVRLGLELLQVREPGEEPVRHVPAVVGPGIVDAGCTTAAVQRAGSGNGSAGRVPTLARSLGSSADATK